MISITTAAEGGFNVWFNGDFISKEAAFEEALVKAKEHASSETIISIDCQIRPKKYTLELTPKELIVLNELLSKIQRSAHEDDDDYDEFAEDSTNVSDIVRSLSDKIEKFDLLQKDWDRSEDIFEMNHVYSPEYDFEHNYPNFLKVR